MSKSGNFDEDNIRINVLCIAGKLPDDVCLRYSQAKAGMRRDVMEEIQAQYLADEPAPEPEAPTKPKVSPDAYKSSTTYKKLQRVLKYQMLKEEVLLEHNHSCDCCDRQFPTRSAWKEMQPDIAYPLMVRWSIPIIKYIEVNQLFDPRKLAADPKVFDMSRYSVLCTDCKPSRFAKK